MIILAIDTCFNACSVALAPGDRPIQSERVPMRQGHAEALLPMIERVMQRAGNDLRDVGLIAVTHGPGTFTGVRTGLAAARALALACGVPAIGFSSLRVIGLAAGGNVLVACDAGRGRAYAQAIGPDGTEIGPPAMLSLADTALIAKELELPVIGSAVPLLAAAGFEIRRADGDVDPDARHLIGCARASPLPDHPPRPLYLREPDAKPQAGAAIARAT